MQNEIKEQQRIELYKKMTDYGMLDDNKFNTIVITLECLRRAKKLPFADCLLRISNRKRQFYRFFYAVFAERVLPIGNFLFFIFSFLFIFCLNF